MASILFPTVHNFEPKHKPFPYQQEAFEALKGLEYCAILHEQGLGKTKIALDLALHWLGEDIVDSVLLVVKKGLLENWRKEIAAHTSLKPKILSQKRSDNYYAFNGPFRLYLTHFEAVKSEKSRLGLFCQTRRVGIIIDEVQKIKNPDAALTKAFLELSERFCRRAIMTGTIVANRPYDIWAPIYFLDGGQSLGHDFTEFKHALDFSANLEDSPEQQRAFEDRLSGVFERIEGFSVRETKDGAGIDLPAKVYRTIFCDWETIQHEMYRQLRDDFRVVVEQAGVPTVDEAESILKRLLRLVQVASNPGLVDERYDRTPGKMSYLEDLLADVMGQGQKAIVWTTFTENADWLCANLQELGAVKVHGKLSIERRNKALSAFCEEANTRVLVATPGAAKEGLTLTVANHVIFYDRSFSLDDYLQAQDRIHRISQTSTCYVHNLVMQDSIDEWVDVLLAEKELAAQLAHGDIELGEFSEGMEYRMFDMLRAVLGIEE